MKCHVCDLDGVKEQATFCPNCGTTLAAADTAGEPSAREKSGGAETSAETGASSASSSSASALSSSSSPGVSPARAGESIFLVAASRLWVETFSSLTEREEPEIFWISPDQIFGYADELEKLNEALQQRRKVMLWGNRGVGKTTLAFKAAKSLVRQAAFADGCIWVSNVGQAPVAAICYAIARHLGEEQLSALKPEALSKATHQLLADKDLLLVLDGLESPPSTELFIKDCVPASVAFLGVSEQEHAGADVYISVGIPGPEAAISLFGDRAKVSADHERIGRICTRLHNNPLALIFAAGFVRGDAGRLARLEALLSDERVSPEAGVPPAEESVHIWKALQISYDDLSDGARHVLSFLGASFGDSLGVELLAGMCGREEKECGPYIEQLTERLMVRRAGDRIIPHPVVREFVRGLLGGGLQSAQEQTLQAALGYAAKYRERSPEHYAKLEDELDNLAGAVRFADESGQWQTVVALVNHLRYMMDDRVFWGRLAELGNLGINAAEQLGEDETLLQMVHMTALTHGNVGNYAAARRLLQRELDIYKRLGRREGEAATLYQMGLLEQEVRHFPQATKRFKESRDLYEQLNDKAGRANTYHQLGIVAQREGIFDEAERHYRRALKIRRALADDSVEVAQSLNNLGLLYESWGGKENYQKALDLFNDALAIYEKEPGKHEAERANSLNNLAKLHYTMGEYEVALKLYEEVLGVRKKVLGEKHPDVAQSLNNLAGVYFMRGEYATAAELLNQALAVYRFSLGENHPKYAITLNNLAGLQHSMGNFSAAESLYVQAMGIYRRKLGKNHPEFAHIMSNVALLYQAQGKHAKAEEYMKQALTIRRTKFGKNHPAYAQILHNLAMLYKATGDYEQAESYLKESIKIRRKTLKPSHPDLILSLKNLAEMYQLRGDYVAAEPLLLEALNAYRETSGEKHVYTTQVMYDLALIYQLLGRAGEAEGLYREVLKVYRELNETNAYYTDSLNNLADLCRVKESYVESEDLYRELLKVCRATKGDNHPYVLQTLISLGQVSRELGKFEQSLSYFAQGLEICKQSKDICGVASLLYNMGLTYFKRGDYRQARESLNESLKVVEQLADKAGIARTLHQLGLVASAEGKYEEARSLLNRSLNISYEMGIKSSIANILQELGSLNQHEGREAEALSYAQAGEEIFGDLEIWERLRNLLNQSMNEKAIQSVLADLGIKAGSMPGKTLHAKVNELTAWVYSNSRINELEESVKRLYPNIKH